MQPRRPARTDQFRDLARELEADGGEARFDERLKRLAAAPHKPKTANGEKPD